MSALDPLPPFERPERTLAAEFENCMHTAVALSALNTFAENLWGLAMTSEFETETVDAYLFFDHEPTDLDRYEISEFRFGFTAATGGGVGIRIHRTVMDRTTFIPDYQALFWCYLRRYPLTELPDDAGFDELDY